MKDQPELASRYPESGVVSERVQRVMLVMDLPGEVTIRAPEVQWWDVGADQAKIAQLESTTLRIAAVRDDPLARANALEVQDRIDAWVEAAWSVAVLGLAIALFRWYWSTQPAREARGQLRAACRRSDPVAARDALAAWARARWPELPPVVVSDFAARTVPPEAHAELAALDRVLYAGREAGAWDGRAAWKALRHLRPRRRQWQIPRWTLPPLLKLQG